MSWGLALGAGLSLLGALQKSKSTKEAGKDQSKAVKESAAENAALSRYDASVMMDQAQEIQYVTGLKLVQHGKMMEAFIGKQKAAYGKSGVSVGTGSALDVVAHTAKQGALDSQTIRYEGEKARSRALSAAKRYRMLADAGLRDAAATASIIEDTANDLSTGQLYSGIGQFAVNAYVTGESFGWWK